jgi:hypothetical protein
VEGRRRIFVFAAAGLVVWAGFEAWAGVGVLGGISLVGGTNGHPATVADAIQFVQGAAPAVVG